MCACLCRLGPAAAVEMLGGTDSQRPNPLVTETDWSERKIVYRARRPSHEDRGRGGEEEEEEGWV